ncbi:hypothetical protein ACFY3V_05335 [Streptosporangium sp. NPDC000095]|uniref:hypothetical protein n=1 Tax=Streptosporangium sp. NPDC000095 TaxID=3366184 RepID=UPI0036C3E469
MILTIALLAGCMSDRSTSSFPEETVAEPEDVTDAEDLGDLEEDFSAILICVKKRTRIRVAYRPCDDAELGFAWYFLSWETKIPATGRKAKGGTFEDPGYSVTSLARNRGGVGPEVALSDEARFEVCVKAETRIRASDSRCDDEDDGFTWYHIPYDDHVPAVGKKAVGGSFYRAGSDRYRAQVKGGMGDEAVIEPDRPNNTPTQRSPRCTRTVNGKCDDATSSCTYIVNGRCRDNGGLPGRAPGRL